MGNIVIVFSVLSGWWYNRKKVNEEKNKIWEQLIQDDKKKGDPNRSGKSVGWGIKHMPTDTLPRSKQEWECDVNLKTRIFNVGDEAIYLDMNDAEHHGNLVRIEGVTEDPFTYDIQFSFVNLTYREKGDRGINVHRMRDVLPSRLVRIDKGVEGRMNELRRKADDEFAMYPWIGQRKR